MRYFLICCCALLIQSSHALKDVAFFYGGDIPYHQFRGYDAVVLQPAFVKHEKIIEHQIPAYAYLSLGEMTEATYNDLGKPTWIIKENHAWQSYVVDLTEPKWQEHILKQVDELQKKGFKGLFLDTVDVYLHSQSRDKSIRQQQSMAQLIQSIKAKYPKLKLMLNRGFEILPTIHQDIDALACEFVYHGFDLRTKAYKTIPDTETTTLETKLKAIQSKYNLPIVVIDYEDESKAAEQKTIADRIKANGFIPWVTDRDLRTIGVGNFEQIPRKIALLTDQSLLIDSTSLNPLRLLAFPIEMLGMTHEVFDIQKPIKNLDKREYAGIIYWPESPYKPNPIFEKWLLKHKQKNIPILFFNSLGFDDDHRLFKAFGFSIKDQQFRINDFKYQNTIGFEHKPTYFAQPNQAIASNAHTVWLTGINKNKTSTDLIGITPWGGFALYPNAFIVLPNQESRWIVNPIELIKHSLKLEAIPKLDTTTLYGVRVATIHIDGDGFGDISEIDPNKHSAQLLYEQVLNIYQKPTSVSIIAKDFSKLAHQEKVKLTSLANRIFAQAWVEPASHTFNHPFVWQDISDTGYVPYDRQSEVKGSIDFINQNFKLRKPSSLIFWSGDANPPSEVIQLAYQYKLLNINGGNSIMTNHRNSISNLSPSYVKKNGYVQVLAPIQNENIYTNLWQGPFYGFQNLIHTFKLTDKDMRYKPLSVYYHFYSATKQASLVALKKIYNYLETIPHNPLFISEYIKIILDFESSTITKTNDGWRIITQGHIKTVRIPKTMGFPDFERCENILGFHDHAHERFIHLGSDTKSHLVLTTHDPKGPYLKQLDAQIVKGTKPEHIMVNVYKRATLHYKIPKHCRLWLNKKQVNDPQNISLNRGEHDIQTKC